jgi:hypothetical protein
VTIPAQSAFDGQSLEMAIASAYSESDAATAATCRHPHFDGLMTPKKSSGGRPAKFAEPSRPVTVTLPERILRQLDMIGPDRAQAIARLVDAAVPNEETRPRVEVAKTGTHTGLIVVGPSQRLKKIPFLQLVEIAPTRFLLALERGHDFRSLEIALRDVLDETDANEENEHSLLTELLEHIQRLRKSARVSMAEILFVRLACTFMVAV